LNIPRNVASTGRLEKSLFQEDVHFLLERRNKEFRLVNFNSHSIISSGGLTYCFDTIQGLPLKHGILSFWQNQIIPDEGGSP
jgi:hypothetical protein